MCIKAAEDYPGTLEVLPDHVKTQEIRYKVVKGDSSSLQVVPDWFITKDWIDMWNDDDKDKPFEWYDDDKAKFFELLVNIIFFEWYDGYQKHKAQKAQIKEEFLPIAWHPNCLIDWYMLEDEKRLWK